MPKSAEAKHVKTNLRRMGDKCTRRSPTRKSARRFFATRRRRRARRVADLDAVRSRRRSALRGISKRDGAPADGAARRNREKSARNAHFCSSQPGLCPVQSLAISTRTPAVSRKKEN